jgi:Rad3-related DNA helicase
MMNNTFFDIPSIFDTARYPIRFMPAADMNHDSIEEESPKMVTAIDEIINLHPDVKGLVHCVSYGNLNFIRKQSRYSGRLIYHGDNNRQVILTQFMSSEEPLVLLSPSMERGIDLPDDNCRFIIIVKMPFPYLGDPQIKARLYQGRSGRSWYNAITARRIVQSTGRGMRSPNDFCESYILDSNFEAFYQKNRSMFPRWWREALILNANDKEVMPLNQ